jgi:hypothetical protein
MSTTWTVKVALVQMRCDGRVLDPQYPDLAQQEPFPFAGLALQKGQQRIGIGTAQPLRLVRGTAPKGCRQSTPAARRGQEASQKAKNGPVGTLRR